MMKENELLAECARDRTHYSEAEAKLYGQILNYWAVLKDYELRNQLLKSLVLDYAALERQIANMNDKLVEADQLKNRLLGFVAHDLRSPLSAVRGLSEIMLSDMIGQLTAEQREFVSTIQTASSEMLALVNDLLDISVIESGRLDLRIGQCALAPLILERLKIFRVAAENKGINFVTDFRNVREAAVDRRRIAQVIDNLIGNAVKFSPANTAIRIGLCEDAGFVRVSVEDEGPGIAPENHQLIFGEFRKIAGDGPTSKANIGLGLAIAKRIIEAHLGELSVKSALGLGSTFSFAIPVGN